MKRVACKVAFSLKLLRSRVRSVRNLPGRLESAILFTQCFVYLRFTSVTVRRLVCSMKSSLLIQCQHLYFSTSAPHAYTMATAIATHSRSYLLTYPCCALATCSSNCLYIQNVIQWQHLYFNTSAAHLYCTCARGMRSMSTCLFSFHSAVLGLRSCVIILWIEGHIINTQHSTGCSHAHTSSLSTTPLWPDCCLPHAEQDTCHKSNNPTKDFSHFLSAIQR